MRELRSYRGVAALVTGASSGIGRALALRLAREGARVALVARRAGELEAAAARITAAGGEALVLPCDVCDRDQVSSACEQALARFGAVDLLVNNAGYGRHRRFVDWDLDDMERMLRVNVLGALSFTKELLPRMVERRRGWLVFMASIAGQIAPPEESVYAASKFALVGFAESLSLEVEDAGVHVLTVCPATVRTPFFDAGTLRRLPPVARRAMVEPEALAEAIVAALAAGRHQLVFPRRFRAACIVRSLAPGFTRRQVKRHALGPARSTGPEGHR